MLAYADYYMLSQIFDYLKWQVTPFWYSAGMPLLWAYLASVQCRPVSLDLPVSLSVSCPVEHG